MFLINALVQGPKIRKHGSNKKKRFSRNLFKLQGVTYEEFVSSHNVNAVNQVYANLQWKYITIFKPVYKMT